MGAKTSIITDHLQRLGRNALLNDKEGTLATSSTRDGLPSPSSWPPWTSVNNYHVQIFMGFGRKIYVAAAAQGYRIAMARLWSIDALPHCAMRTT